MIIKPTLNTHTQIKNWFGKRWLMFFGRSKKIMIANQSKWLPIFKIGILQRKARCAYKHPKTDYIYKFLNRSLSVAHIVQGGVCVSWSYTSPTYALLSLFFDIGVIVIGR